MIIYDYFVYVRYACIFIVLNEYAYVAPLTACILFIFVELFTCINHWFMFNKHRSLQHSNIKWNLSSLNENAVGSRGIRSGIRSPCGVARRRYGLAKLQTKLCRTSMEAMPFVQAAAALAAETCKIVFQHRRWNCSSIDKAPYLTPDLTRGMCT